MPQEEIEEEDLSVIERRDIWSLRKMQVLVCWCGKTPPLLEGDMFIEYNRVDIFCPWGPKIWPMEANNHIILYVIPSSDWGLLLCSRNFLYENNVCRYVLTLLSGDLSMILKLSCPSNKSS